MLTDEDIKKQRHDIDRREKEIHSRLNQIEIKLADTPDPEEVKRQSVFAGKILSDVRMRPGTLLRKPYELKRRFIEHCFSGKDTQGQPLGVYLTLINEKQYQVEVRGLLGSTVMGWEKIQSIALDHISSKDKNNLSLRRNPITILY